MNILTDILSLFKRKKVTSIVKPNDVVVVAKHEAPDMEGIASPVPYKSVELVRVRDLITAQDLEFENVPIGDSSSGCFKDKTNDPVTGEGIVNLRRLKSLSLNLNIDENGDFIEFDNLAEANTASNVGDGVGVFKQKVGEDLEFKSITSVDGSVNIADNGSTIDLAAGASGEVNTASNLGAGTGLFAQKDAEDLEFKSLTSTGGTVTITDDSTTVNIESSGEANTASNVGGAPGEVFFQKTGEDLELRTINSTNKSILIDQTTDPDVIDLRTNIATDGTTVTGDGTASSPLTAIGSGTGGTQLLTGAAAYSGTGLIFDVSDLTYIIDGNSYSTAATQVTLSNGDPSNGRFDAIVADDTGTVSVVQGVPSATPSTPTLSPEQVLVQYVLVGTNASTPNITTEYVYREGSTPDWTGAISGINNTADFSSTTPTPFQGTECVLGSVGQYGWNRGVGFVAPAPISRSQYTILSFRIQITEDLVAAGVSRFYVFGWAGTAFSNYNTRIGYKRIDGLIDTTASAIGTWQLVNIPVSNFTMFQQNTTIGGIWFALYPNRPGFAPATFALDDIKFQTGYGPTTNSATIDVFENDQIVGDASRLNFKDTDSISVTVTDDAINNKMDIEFDAVVDNFKFLKTSVCAVTTSAVTDYATISLANSTTFSLVEWNPSAPSTPATHKANIQFNRPTDGSNYVRIFVEMSVRTGTSSGEFIHCGLHHTPSTTTLPTYGWETVGADGDASDVAVYHVTFDVRVSDMLDWSGFAADPGELCFFFLMLTSSSSSTDIYVGKQWSVAMSSTATPSPGPITFTAHEITSGSRLVNPPENPPS